MPIALSPLQLIAGASLANNQGISLSTELSNAVNSLTGTTLLTPYFATLAGASAANVTSTNITTLIRLSTNTVPVLSDTTPAAYAATIGALPGSGGAYNANGFTQIIENIGNKYLGNGDLTIFAQLFPAAIGYVTQNNDYIHSVNNTNTYLGATFTSMNNLITGSLSDVTLAMPAFGADLTALGLAINLGNLENLGAPWALLQQINAVSGLTPGITNALVGAGITYETLVSVGNKNYSVSDSVQRQIYNAFLAINTTDNPTELAQILEVMQVTTPFINSLADLLNPVKMFPNSFQSLRVRTGDGLLPIYLNSDGTINSNLVETLPPYVISTVT